MHAALIDWTTSACAPNTKTAFGWLVTWDNIRADSTEGGRRLRPTTCDFWFPEMRASVDVAGPIEDRGFHVIFEAQHFFGPHDEDKIPNPFSVMMSVLDPHLYPPPQPGQKREWFFVPIEGGSANPGFIEHPTTTVGVDHSDTFGLWALVNGPGPGATHFWFSGIHCGGTTAPGVVAPSQTCAGPLPQPPSIPEPLTIVLVGSGLVGLMVKRRRQRAP